MAREKKVLAVEECTGLSRKAVELGMQLAVEMAACTTMSPRETWGIVKRFFDAFTRGFRLYKSTGYDPTEDLITFAVRGVSGGRCDDA